MSITGASAQTFAYDAAGNTVAKGALEFSYNDANRLASVSASGSPLASYRYNARGERVRKSAGGETRLYHYDLEGNLLGEHAVGGALRRAYVYVAGERVALLQASDPGPSGLFFYHNDPLGTPKVITDQAQSIVWAVAHTPFGTALVSVNEVDNPWRFPGQYFDQETGLHYNYFRDYDPSIGRYVESDPIGITRSNINLYQYASLNPLNFVDPSGLLEWQGTFSLFELGKFGSASFLADFTLESECDIDGKRKKILLSSNGSTISFGLPTKLEGEVTFDGPGQRADENLFLGEFTFSSFGFNFGEFGVGALRFRAGEMFSTKVSSNGESFGVTFGTLTSNSNVRVIEETTCGC